MGRQTFGGSAEIEPRGILLESGKEMVEPGLLIAVFEGAGPSAELFHVVAHGGDAIGMGREGVAQVSDGFVDGVPGDQVTQGFLPGNDTDGLALVFGNVIAKELGLLETRGKEVDVVENGVANVAFGEDRGELRFPNAFGKPGAGWAATEVLLDVIRELHDLLVLVGGWDGNQDRLVKSATQHFDLTAAH